MPYLVEPLPTTPRRHLPERFPLKVSYLLWNKYPNYWLDAFNNFCLAFLSIIATDSIHSDKVYFWRLPYNLVLYLGLCQSPFQGEGSLVTYLYETPRQFYNFCRKLDYFTQLNVAYFTQWRFPARLKVMYKSHSALYMGFEAIFSSDPGLSYLSAKLTNYVPP